MAAALLTLVWALLPLGLSAHDTVGVALPALAGLVIAVVIALDPAALRPLLKPRAKDVLLGLVAGVAMVLLTGPSFALAAKLIPVLQPWVAEDYTRLAPFGTWAFLPRMGVVIVAEELLWRHAWLAGRGPEHPGRGRAALGSVVAYGVAQAGIGSPAVMALGLACGAAWTALRLRTDGLWAPLLCHAIWSPSVMLFFPVA